MSVIKSYAKLDVAEKILAKLVAKDGLAREIKEVDGKFQIITTAPPETEISTGFTDKNTLSDKEEADLDAALQEQADGNEDDAVSLNDLPKSLPTKTLHGDTVTVEIAGAKLTAQYVITPTLGDKPRWFERKRLQSAEAIEGGVRIVCAPKELTSRKLGHLLTALDTKANAVETEEQAAEAAAA